jgi:hypothetical protein
MVKTSIKQSPNWTKGYFSLYNGDTSYNDGASLKCYIGHIIFSINLVNHTQFPFNLIEHL